MVLAHRIAIVLVCLSAITVGEAADANLEGPLKGRKVIEVLRAMERPGLRFVFSSQLLPDSLRIAEEPPATDELQTARNLIEPHGLALARIESGIYAVVRAPPATGATLDEEARMSGPQDDPLHEVVVSASRYRIGGDDIASASRLNGQALRTQPGLGEDALRALQRLPGLAHDGFSARSNVRGGEASETLLLLDGFPLRQAFHLPAYQAFFSVIDSQLIHSAEVYTGGFPARYGNRMSAVFDLRSVDALAQPQRSFALDFFNASARVSGGKEGDSARPGYDWLASGRIGTLKSMPERFAPEIGNPEYSDLYLRAGWGTPERLRLTANMLISRDEISVTREQRGERGDLESLARYIWLRADHDWSESLRASLWLGHTRLESIREGSDNEPLISVGTVQDSRASYLTDLRGNVSWQFHPRHLMEAGIELTDEDARYVYSAEALFAPEVATLFERGIRLDREASLFPDRARGSVHASWRWRLSDDITTQVGGRAQRLLTRGLSADWISEPRLGVRWQALPGTRLQATWGRFNQIEEIDELRIEDGATQFAAAQRSEHLIVGIEQRLSNRIGLRLEAFRKRQSSPRARYENVLDTQTVFPEIAPDRAVISPDRAKLVGVEFSVNYDDPVFSVWGTLGWSNSEDFLAGKLVPRSWDQRWTLTGGTQWARAQWLLSAQVNVHEGWPSTRLMQGAAGQTVLGPRNGNRLSMFAQLDLRAQYTRNIQRGELAFVAQLVNATNRPNECCTELVVRDGELAGRSLQWLPVVPSLGVRWSF